jgi:hypothetical protein
MTLKLQVSTEVHNHTIALHPGEWWKLNSTPTLSLDFPIKIQ